MFILETGREARAIALINVFCRICNSRMAENTVSMPQHVLITSICMLHAFLLHQCPPITPKDLVSKTHFNLGLSLPRSRSRSVNDIQLIIIFHGQGCFYVANEYPTYARNMLLDNRKLKISGQIFLNREDKSVCFDEKQANFRVKHANSLIL